MENLYFERDFSRSWNFQKLFLTFQSTISEVFETFYRQLFEKWSKNHRKKQFFVKFWRFQIFPRKTAVYVSFPYSKEHSCQKSKKSSARFSVTLADARAGISRHTIQNLSCGLTVGENSYMYSRANISRTQSSIDMRFSQDGSWHFPLSFPMT